MPISKQESNRFFVKRGTKSSYLKAQKYQGEIYYLTDTNELASDQTIYHSKIDGGYFADYTNRSKYDGVDGGEF